MAYYYWHTEGVARQNQVSLPNNNPTEVNTEVLKSKNFHTL